jgi:uncharacterized coiled-coil protein SlyX
MNLFRLKNGNSTNQKFNERALLPIALVLICFALSPMAQAVSPPPDGGYPGENTAEGTDALFSLTPGFGTGVGNTAVGFNALYSNTIGNVNTAVGDFALHDNIDGTYNTATGFTALNDNTTGIFNTADGGAALKHNTTGKDNTASGMEALHNNTTGKHNTASGFEALYNNRTGNLNTANGAFALLLSTGSNNIGLGHKAGLNLTTGDNNIDIGNQGVAAEANTIRIGKQGTQTATFIAGVSGAGVMGVAVKVNAAGQLGTAPSSVRFKENIKPMDKASEAIHALKPVTFCYKQELDPEGIPQFGLVAEQVEKVNPDLVARDAKGEVYTVRYEAVNAMLLNEFLKEHRTVQELKSTVAKQEAIIAQQQKGMEAVTARLDKQASQIQKVSARIEVTKPAPQVVNNNQ